MSKKKARNRSEEKVTTPVIDKTEVKEPIVDKEIVDAIPEDTKNRVINSNSAINQDDQSLVNDVVRTAKTFEDVYDKLSNNTNLKMLLSILKTRMTALVNRDEKSIAFNNYQLYRAILDILVMTDKVKFKNNMDVLSRLLKMDNRFSDISLNMYDYLWVGKPDEKFVYSIITTYMSAASKGGHTALNKEKLMSYMHPDAITNITKYYNL